MPAKLQPHYKPGDRIGGRYQVHQVKMGGMGEIYLCLDLELNYPFALKTFQQRYQSTALRKAFEQEVTTWISLEKHPNIVRCFMMEILDNRPFIVLEWIAGEKSKGTDLRGWLRYGPLGLRAAIEIILDILHGLIFAQEKQPGLVHRDLKPENLLMPQGGQARITDFGLAQIVKQVELGVESLPPTPPEGGVGSKILPFGGIRGQRQSLVQRGSVVGTPAYMAPEQWRGEALDERTDIYAVGCILYELLTGLCPFRVDFIAAMSPKQWLDAMQNGHETLPPPALPTEIPGAVTELVQSCLAKQPGERPVSLAVLLAQLSTIYERKFDQPPPTRPIVGNFSANDYVLRGNTYTELKQYEAALADFNRSIELDPNNFFSYKERGVTYHKLQWYKQALNDFDRAIELNSEFAEAYMDRGNTYRALQKLHKALDDLNRAIEINPKFALAYMNRGITYRVLQQSNQALDDYNHAVELDSDLTQAYYNRGNIYNSLQKYQLALVDYNRAIELNPEYATAYSNRGVIYYKLQQYEQALNDLNRAIKLNPESATHYINRAAVYNELQQHELTLLDFNRAIEIEPTLAQAHSNIGIFLELANFQMAIQLDPTNAQNYFNRGFIYYKIEEYQLALNDYNRAIELDPTHAFTYINRGATFRALGRYERALKDYSQAIRLNPSLADGYFNRGNLYNALEKYELALADYNWAIQIDPIDSKFYVNRAVTYSHIQRAKEALVDLHRAIELNPNDAVAYYALGGLLVNTGQLPESLPYFEQAAQLGFAQAHQVIAQVRQMLGEVSTTSPTDPAQAAFEAFQQANSPTGMRQVVAQFPFLVEADFIEMIEQVTAQEVPSEHRPYFEERLRWLKEIAGQYER